VVAAIFVAWFYPLTRQQYEQIRAALDARQKSASASGVSDSPM